MTNFIEKLKQVAAGRTGGKWSYNEAFGVRSDLTSQCGEPLLVAEHTIHRDGEFITEAGNCFDELVAVAEAAIDLTKSGAIRGCAAEVDLENAIAALRQKVEGEGG